MFAPVAGALDDVAEAIPPGARKFLGGDDWLGHPLHPALTDLPIGFWTSSWVLDIFGGRRSRRLATALVGLGVVSAAPTVAAGVVEWSKLGEEKRETGVLHMVANVVATFLYTCSFLARLRGRRGKGIALGMLAATAATVGGYLGGQLAYGKTEPTTADTGVPPDAELHIRVAV